MRNSTAALQILGFDDLTYYAAGEILDILHRYRRYKHLDGPRISDADLAEHITELATGPSNRLHPCMKLPADELQAAMERALQLLLSHNILRHGADGMIEFTIPLNFNFTYRDSAPAEKQRVRELNQQLCQINQIPAGSVFLTTAAQGYGQLKRSTRVNPVPPKSWYIYREGSGYGTEWMPPCLCYAGSGGYWRDVIAAGPIAQMMSQVIDAQPQLAA